MQSLRRAPWILTSLLTVVLGIIPNTAVFDRTPPPARAATCLAEISQSSSFTIQNGWALACIYNTQYHRAQSYYRAFPMSQFVSSGLQYRVSSGDLAILIADAGGTATSQPISVYLHRSTANPPRLSTLQLVSFVDVMVTDQSSTMLNVPITGLFNSTDTLVVEVRLPDGFANQNVL